MVDNGSTDGTIEYLKSLNDITLIENNTNLGYAKAVNIGIRASAKNNDIVLLNNDTEIKNFDLYKYAKAELVHHNDNHSTFKTLFNEEFGGDPLRATLIDVDLSNNKN